MKFYTTALAAAALSLAAAPAWSTDFMHTISGQAPLAEGADQAACSQAAEASLAGQRAQLEKQCEQDNGLFNYGLVTAEIHAHSCTAAQTLTCSGTGGPAAAQAAPAVAGAREPAEHQNDERPLKAKPGRPRKKAKPARIQRAPTKADPTRPKSKAHRHRRNSPLTSPSSEIREVRTDSKSAYTGREP